MTNFGIFLLPENFGFITIAASSRDMQESKQDVNIFKK